MLLNKKGITKTLAIIIAVIIVIGAVGGCLGVYFITQKPAAPIPTSTPTPEPTPQAASKVTVGLILAGPANDLGWSQFCYEGFKAAEDKGLIELILAESVGYEDGARVMRDLIENKGVDLLYAHSGGYLADAYAIQDEYPDTKVLLVYDDINWHSEQAAYLQGVMAGEIMKENDYDTAGIVMAGKFSYTFRTLNGFLQGLKATNPTTSEPPMLDIEVHYDVAKGKEGALSLLDAGVDIIYGNGNGAALGFIEAAKERGVLYQDGVGDKSSIAPDTFLSGVRMNWVDMVEEIIDDINKGTYLSDGPYWLSLENGGVQITDVPDWAPASAVSAMNDAKQKITSGEIQVIEEEAVFLEWDDI